VQIAQDGVVWMEFSETIVRRFDTHPTARKAETFPERFGLAVRQPEGWVLAFDSWTDPVSRTMASFTILGSAGAAEFDRIPTVRQPSWLLGRIAAKDAVRHVQWDAGIAEVYPIELTVSNDPGGRPRVTPRTGAGLIDCDVSLAHCREAAVALAMPRAAGADPSGPGVGIDIAEITTHPENTLRYALGDDEQRLLEQLADGDRDAWFARFWAAKEAVGKAEHTGLDGRPRAFVVRAADATGLTVTVSDRTYRVGLRDVANAAGLPPRRYAVAWTWGPELSHQAARSTQ
jgi:phosphopantetheinyl transferase (holo-ACP synthase)